jgi:PAS domain S-box-containing protein
VSVSTTSGGFVHGLTSVAAHAGNVPGPTGWDALPDAVIVAKGNGTVTWANRATTALLGWPADELVGQPVDVLVLEAHRPLVASGAGWRDVTARHRAGEDVPVELWVAEEGPSVVIVARDRRPALAAATEAALTDLPSWPAPWPTSSTTSSPSSSARSASSARPSPTSTESTPTWSEFGMPPSGAPG